MASIYEGNNLVKLSSGANSIGEIELKDGASVYLQGWGDSFRVAVNGEGTGLSHFIDENGMYKGEQKIAQKSKAKSTTRI